MTTISKHRFAIGQRVSIKHGFLPLSEKTETYRITQTLPASGGSNQYRIRNDTERHERMVTEDNLVSAFAPNDDNDVFRS